jgi:hypothetical protein
MFLDAAPHILAQRQAMSTVKKNMRSSFYPTPKGRVLFETAFDGAGIRMPNS